MKQLGTLRRLDPRTIWSDEARDFTPWLAENIGQLGAALGIDLELTNQEAPVGDFSLDLLARDLGRDRVVTIENQLSPTNHDHLGKLVTYASGYDARVVIWVSREIREEHRQAIDWLNQRTDAETEFYAVQIEILQIDECAPAVQFRPVAAPNSWRKDVGPPSAPGSVSPRARAYQRFLQTLVDEMRERHRFTNSRRATPASWHAFASGVGGISYNAAFASGNRVRAEMYIDLGEERWNKGLFDALEAKRAEFDREIGENLVWDRLDGRRACRISAVREGNIEMPDDKLVEIRSWLSDRLLQMKKVFGATIASEVEKLED